MSAKRKAKKSAAQWKRRQNAILRAEAKLLKAMESADARGYTGFVSGKSLFDDPHVKRAMKGHERAIHGSSLVRKKKSRKKRSGSSLGM